MNPDTLIYFTAAERRLVQLAIVQDSVNTLQEFIELSMACCDEHHATFVGEVAEA